MWNTWFEIGNGPNFRLGGSDSGGIVVDVDGDVDDVGGDDGFLACSAVSLSTPSAVISARVIISKILEVVMVNVYANVWWVASFSDGREKVVDRWRDWWLSSWCMSPRLF